MCAANYDNSERPDIPTAQFRLNGNWRNYLGQVRFAAQRRGPHASPTLDKRYCSPLVIRSHVASAPHDPHRRWGVRGDQGHAGGRLRRRPSHKISHALRGFLSPKLPVAPAASLDICCGITLSYDALVLFDLAAHYLISSANRAREDASTSLASSTSRATPSSRITCRRSPIPTWRNYFRQRNRPLGLVISVLFLQPCCLRQRDGCSFRYPPVWSQTGRGEPDAAPRP
jgi:hypothetical protein